MQLRSITVRSYKLLGEVFLVRRFCIFAWHTYNRCELVVKYLFHCMWHVFVRQRVVSAKEQEIVVVDPVAFAAALALERSGQEQVRAGVWIPGFQDRAQVIDAVL